MHKRENNDINIMQQAYNTDQDYEPKFINSVLYKCL